MPTFFKFAADDDIITSYLSVRARQAVTTWQTRDNYDFEFHNGHLTGFPVYIRPVTMRALMSKIPKFDTLNKKSSDYDTITKFANDDNLTSALNLQTCNEIVTLVTTNWAVFRELAVNFHNGTPAVEQTPEQIEEAHFTQWVESETQEHGAIEVRHIAAFRKSYFLD